MFDQNILLPQGCEQVLHVVAEDENSYEAHISVYDYAEVAWRRTGGPYPCAVGKNGVSEDKIEGDGKTPAGVFALSHAMGFLTKPFVHHMAMVPIRFFDVWVDDEQSELYNTATTLPNALIKGARSFEMLMRPVYRQMLVVDYNRHPVEKGRGSAIFIHRLKKNRPYTAGCIALDERDLLSLYDLLDGSKGPVLFVEVSPTASGRSPERGSPDPDPTAR
ncbi:MAG: L,D-transpeptidase family protein [Christensenellales bacterium]